MADSEEQCIWVQFYFKLGKTGTKQHEMKPGFIFMIQKPNNSSSLMEKSILFESKDSEASQVKHQGYVGVLIESTVHHEFFSLGG
jgi:hypothetical protein